MWKSFTYVNKFSDSGKVLNCNHIQKSFIECKKDSKCKSKLLEQIYGGCHLFYRQI